MFRFDPTPVRMCVCSGLTFQEMKERGLSFEQLKEQLGVSDGCGSCRIYVERMLITGEVAFPVDLPNLSGGDERGGNSA